MEVGRGERVAAGAVFVMTGLVSATWAADIPATQHRLSLSTGELGLLVLSIEGGALVGLPVGGVLVSRWGPRACLRLGFAVYPGLLVPMALVPSLGWLATVLLIWALANSVIDVAMNAAGVYLEARWQRPTLSRLHAGQSLGLLLGGLAAVVATASHVRLPVHFGVIALVSAGAALIGTVRLPPRGGASGSPTLARPSRPLMLLGVVAFCGFLLDGSAGNWTAVDLQSTHQASAAFAAAGYTSFIATVGLGRLAGDRAIARFPRARIVQACGTTAAGGALLVVLAPNAVAALAGWVVVGVGISLIAPTVLGAAAGDGRTASPPTALAAVTTLGYLGSFSGPPGIAALASLSGLSHAFGLLIVAGCAAALLSTFAWRGSATSQDADRIAAAPGRESHHRLPPAQRRSWVRARRRAVSERGSPGSRGSPLP